MNRELRPAPLLEIAQGLLSVTDGFAEFQYDQKYSAQQLVVVRTVSGRPKV